MKRKYVYLYLLGLLLFSVACTGNFRDYNTDLSGITDDDLIIDDNGYGIRLGIIQQGIYFNYDFGKGKNWPFQLIQNLNADMFGGYMHDGKPLNGGSHNSDYNMQDGWNSAMWTHMYSYIFPQIYQSENATRNTHPALFGITKILKVEAMHRVTDYYGPIIYKNFANAEKHYRPDKQEDVYYEFFNELDSAVVALTGYIEEKPESNGFARVDILLDVRYRGDSLPIDKDALLKACMIPMPVDQKRNMMNASSNFNIIYSILDAISNKKKVKIHTPGVNGEIGGYPYIIDATGSVATSYFDTSIFSMEKMRMINRESIYLDGVADIKEGNLYYTPELVEKVKNVWGKDLPLEVHFNDIDEVGQYIIDNIIKPATNC